MNAGNIYIIIPYFALCWVVIMWLANYGMWIIDYERASDFCKENGYDYFIQTELRTHEYCVGKDENNSIVMQKLFIVRKINANQLLKQFSIFFAEPLIQEIYLIKGN